MKTNPPTDLTGGGAPWIFDGDYVVADSGSYTQEVCRCDNIADGNLIAAAPQMYDLLRRVDQGETPFSEIVLTLAKARGEEI